VVGDQLLNPLARESKESPGVSPTQTHSGEGNGSLFGRSEGSFLLLRCRSLRLSPCLHGETDFAGQDNLLVQVRGERILCFLIVFDAGGDGLADSSSSRFEGSAIGSASLKI
jgi:hypothetical protein